MISLIGKYIDQKYLIKSTARSVKKTINLAKLEISKRNYKLENSIKEPRVICVENKNDVFYRKMVVSGGAFGMGKK